MTMRHGLGVADDPASLELDDRGDPALLHLGRGGAEHLLG
jgi:hypothetical protein